MQYASDKVQRPYVPKAVITAYQKYNGYDYYLESREVLEDGTIGASRPVTLDFLKSIAKAYGRNREGSPHGAVPPHLLFADTRAARPRIVWWAAPARKTLCFTDKVPLPDGEYNMPGVIYSLEGRTLSVYSFRGRRPGKNCTLLHGPFFNYYEDCKMCLGNSRIDIPKNPTWEELILCWENVFWNSLNAHLIFDPVKGNIVTELRKAQTQPFDISKCKETKLKLKDILK